MVGWMDGWRDGWMEGWMGSTYAFIDEITRYFKVVWLEQVEHHRTM
jgi:hypothetical protein